MYILGIHGAGLFGHDSAACLVKDGKLIAAAEEERFIRRKHASGIPPINAMNFCLQKAGISIGEVGHIAVPWESGMKMAAELPLHYMMRGELFRQQKQFFGEIRNLGRLFLRGTTRDMRIKGFKGEVVNVNHHIGHSASAFNCSGFKEAAIMSFDNKGETTSTLLSHGTKDGIGAVKDIKWFDSLGLFYGAFTEYLGFQMSDGEGKTMALAAYGEPKHDLGEFIRWDENKKTYKVDSNYFYRLGHYSERFVERFGKPGKNPLKQADVAASAQKTLEEIALKLGQQLGEETRSKNLCLAGGVALNCVMNGRLLRELEFEKVFVQPAANDAGSAIGAAMELYRKLGGKRKFEMGNAYLGPEFSNEEIEKAIWNLIGNDMKVRGKWKSNRVKIEFHKDIAGVAAELIAKNLIGGWFQGRMELGPRALGARSIIANPAKKGIEKKVNLKVKHREPWRPFAPSLLDVAKDEYLEDACKSPFMILSFFVRENKRKEIPAVVHVDGTTRPQTVEKSENPLYWKLIKEFESETGLPVILNTSFNDHGEPIVMRPEEAVNDFLGTGMDFLAIGNWLLKKG